MEQKLADYRARKAREFNGKNIQDQPHQHDYYEGKNAKSQDAQIWSVKEKSMIEHSNVGQFFNKLHGINGILKIALWFSLWMFFIKIEFGAVFFAISLILVLYFSMNNSRNKNELSAYSVFNKNFERIDGTFTAEQFDKSLRKGGGMT